MNDKTAARIRTVWPLALGHAAALLASWILRLTGVEVDSLLLVELLGLAASWAVWELGRRLESSLNPIAQAVGRWLLSMGKEIGAPSYGVPPAETVTEYDHHGDGSLKTIRTVTTYPPRASS